MSYRHLKRLLGETSLERKCRFLLGAGILLLITSSFWLYARQTESLVYDQTAVTCRLLVKPIIAGLHVESEQVEAALLQFQRDEERHWSPELKEYEVKLIKPNARNPKHQPDSDEIAILNTFLDGDKQEDKRPLPAQNTYFYYGAVRASADCLKCHGANAADPQERADMADLREGGLMALARIKIPTKAVESGFHLNRAILLSAALVTAILIMAGSFLIIRYVIVKPVKHLKQVSDAIAAGELNVRSEIQTGDEFEDLSHAFNRMLRNLIGMQERFRKLNADLDKKVDELARMNMHLYESDRLKGDFLATMSHELRTPLNSILGFSEVLQSGDNLTDKQRRWSANIQTSGTQLLNLINDILDLAKIEAGKMEVRPEEFALTELTDRELNMFRPMAEKKNIDLRSQVDAALPALRQDPVKLRQIVTNLLSNAVKFTPEGGRVLLKAEAEGPELVLTVADTGVGIAADDQERIFEKFRQSDNPLTREHGGTGLGLSIVRELAKLLGGTVTLRSELGRGSTFTVRLPVRYRDEARPREEPRPDFTTPVPQPAAAPPA